MFSYIKGNCMCRSKTWNCMLIYITGISMWSHINFKCICKYITGNCICLYTTAKLCAYLHKKELYVVLRNGEIYV
jgi:hypothetical protein